MGNITLTQPTGGTTITAALHATNYGNIQTLVNGNLEDINIKAAAGIAYSKLTLAGSIVNADVASSAAIALSKLAATVPYVYDRVTTGVDVQTSVAETSLYTKSVTGNDMGTNRMLRLTLLGDYLHNNVAGDAFTLRIKFGGTTFYAQSGVNFNNSVGSARHPWRLSLHISNLGAANSQMIEGQLPVEFASASAPTTGIGAWASPSNPLLIQGLGISTLGTIDTTTAQTLDVTAQWAVSSANNSWRMRYAVLELV